MHNLIIAPTIIFYGVSHGLMFEANQYIYFCAVVKLATSKLVLT